jgi:hypothetical protein
MASGKACSVQNTTSDAPAIVAVPSCHHGGNGPCCKRTKGACCKINPIKIVVKKEAVLSAGQSGVVVRQNGSSSLKIQVKDIPERFSFAPVFDPGTYTILRL